MKTFYILLMLLLSLNMQANEFANIYIFFDRVPSEISSKIIEGNHKMSILINDELVYKLRFGNALHYKRINTGEISISLSQTTEIKLNVENGKSYYIGLCYRNRKWTIEEKDSSYFYKKFKNASKIKHIKEGDAYIIPEEDKPKIALKEDVETYENYSVIYFLSEDPSSKTLELWLNNRFVTTFLSNEIVKYKIYSKGKVWVTIMGSKTKEGLIEVNKNTTYYYCGFDRKKKILEVSFYNEVVKKDVFYAAKNQLAELRVINYKKIEFEEDINNPIGELPEGVASGGPGQGSGFLLNTEGFIVTNHHVIDNAKKITVTGVGGDFYTSHQADVVASDPNNDLAIIKLKNPNLKFEQPPYGIRASIAETGEDVFVLGYPAAIGLGEEIKLTNGVISSMSGFEGNVGEYQISAPIQLGNSGGPLFDKKGNLIGVINATVIKADNVSYAIKSLLLQTFIQLSGKPISLPNGDLNKLENLPLNEQIKLIKNFVYIIEVE